MENTATVVKPDKGWALSDIHGDFINLNSVIRLAYRCLLHDEDKDYVDDARNTLDVALGYMDSIEAKLNNADR